MVGAWGQCSLWPTGWRRRGGTRWGPHGPCPPPLPALPLQQVTQAVGVLCVHLRARARRGTEEGASLPLRDLLRGLVGQQHASGGARPWTPSQTLLLGVACPYCQECLRSAGVGGLSDGTDVTPGLCRDAFLRRESPECGFVSAIPLGLSRRRGPVFPRILPASAGRATPPL